MKSLPLTILLALLSGCTRYALLDVAERDGDRATTSIVASGPCWSPPPAPVHSPAVVTTQAVQTGGNTWQAPAPTAPLSEESSARGQLLFYLGGGALIAAGCIIGYLIGWRLGAAVAVAGVAVIVAARVLLVGPWALILAILGALGVMVYFAFRYRVALTAVVAGIANTRSSEQEIVKDNIRIAAKGPANSKSRKARIDATIDSIKDKLPRAPPA